MSLLEWIGSQFINPRGFVGKIIANAMEKHNRIIYEWVFPMCVHEGDAVLEIGFGHGLGLNMIAQQYKPSLVHGIDISADMCKAATARLKHELPAGSDIFCGDALSDSRLSQYDSLLAVNIVYFWNDLFPAARKLAGLTRPGGRLCLYMVSPKICARSPLPTMTCSTPGLLTRYCRRCRWPVFATANGKPRRFTANRASAFSLTCRNKRSIP
jgi:SAM-dependent methyltransferase